MGRSVKCYSFNTFKLNHAVILFYGILQILVNGAVLNHPNRRESQRTGDFYTQRLDNAKPKRLSLRDTNSKYPAFYHMLGPGSMDYRTVMELRKSQGRSKVTRKVRKPAQVLNHDIHIGRQFKDLTRTKDTTDSCNIIMLIRDLATLSSQSEYTFVMDFKRTMTQQQQHNSMKQIQNFTAETSNTIVSRIKKITVLLNISSIPSYIDSIDEAFSASVRISIESNNQSIQSHSAIFINRGQNGENGMSMMRKYCFQAANNTPTLRNNQFKGIQSSPEVNFNLLIEITCSRTISDATCVGLYPHMPMIMIELSSSNRSLIDMDKARNNG